MSNAILAARGCRLGRHLIGTGAPSVVAVIATIHESIDRTSIVGKEFLHCKLFTHMLSGLSWLRTAYENDTRNDTCEQFQHSLVSLVN